MTKGRFLKCLDNGMESCLHKYDALGQYKKQELASYSFMESVFKFINKKVCKN